METSSKILFVDDEPNILSAIKRALYSKRDTWEMYFANSGSKALDIIQENSIDLVVSDVKMPEMDGIELLGIIKDNFPDIIRVVLSGHTERKPILYSFDAAHQFLTKPFKNEDLVKVIEQGLNFKNITCNSNLKKIINNMNMLPSLPPLYHEIVAALHNENNSVSQIGQTISKDIIMTAKLLKLANSAFFSFNKNISSAVDAARFIGLDAIKDLVLFIHIFSEFDEDVLKKAGINDIWDHSLNVANLSKKLMQVVTADKQLQETAYTSGLLHDIGKVILAVNQPEIYNSIATVEFKDHQSFLKKEVKYFGTDHQKIGGYLIGVWGLPHVITETVFYHHTPQDSSTREFNKILPVVCAANALENKNNRYNKINVDKNLKLEYISSMYSKEIIEEWIKIGNQKKQASDNE